jgi:hypothetical protein
MVFLGNEGTIGGDIVQTRIPRPKTPRTLVRRKKESTSMEHWGLQPWRAWRTTLGDRCVPTRRDGSVTIAHDSSISGVEGQPNEREETERDPNSG